MEKWEKNPRVSTQCPHIFCINCIRSYCHLVNSVTLKSYNKSKEYITLIPCQHIIIWTTKTFFLGGGLPRDIGKFRWHKPFASSKLLEWYMSWNTSFAPWKHKRSFKVSPWNFPKMGTLTVRMPGKLFLVIC